jgi:cytochrome c553
MDTSPSMRPRSNCDPRNTFKAAIHVQRQSRTVDQSKSGMRKQASPGSTRAVKKQTAYVFQFELYFGDGNSRLSGVQQLCESSQSPSDPLPGGRETMPSRHVSVTLSSSVAFAAVALLLTSTTGLHRVFAQTGAPQASAPQAADPAAAARPVYQLEAPKELQHPELPSWAFTPVSPGPRVARPVDDGTLLHVPGSDKAFTRTQINDGYAPPDWFPEQHPPAPKEATNGRKPVYQACGLCHLVSGYGRPENQSIAGLPAGYILEQIEDFKNDLRHSSVPNMGVITMIPVAKGITPEEAKEAADYYAAIKPPAHYIRVVETNTVPKTRPNARMMVLDEAGGTEPIGNRVIEVPEDVKLAEMRDSASGFVAYVPVGSLKLGETIVRTGAGGKTIACVTCHGQDLRGMGNIPRIAGRSPSQMARQLYDFKTGARNGVNAPLMKGVVANLTDTDIVNITAYLASLSQ